MNCLFSLRHINCSICTNQYHIFFGFKTQKNTFLISQILLPTIAHLFLSVSMKDSVSIATIFRTVFYILCDVRTVCFLFVVVTFPLTLPPSFNRCFLIPSLSLCLLHYYSILFESILFHLHTYLHTICQIILSKYTSQTTQ